MKSGPASLWPRANEPPRSRLVRLGDVAVAAQPADPAHVAALVRLEQPDVALVDLAGRLEEQDTGSGSASTPRCRNRRCPSSPPSRFCITSGSSTHGSACACSVLTLPICSLELADLRQQPAGQRRERDEPFLDLDAFRRERRGRSRRARTDRRSPGSWPRLRSSRTPGVGLIAFLPPRPEEVADHRHVGVEDLRQRARRCRRPAATRRAARARRTGWNRHVDRRCGCLASAAGAGGAAACAGTGGRRRVAARPCAASFASSAASLRAVGVANRLELLPQPVQLVANLLLPALAPARAGAGVCAEAACARAMAAAAQNATRRARTTENVEATCTSGGGNH